MLKRFKATGAPVGKPNPDNRLSIGEGRNRPKFEHAITMPNSQNFATILTNAFIYS
jgi:hypothetical protein